MATNTSYYFDLGANNTVAFDTVSGILSTLLNNAGTEIVFDDVNIDGLKNQLKNMARAALVLGSVSQLAMSLERPFSSRVHDEKELKEMYASFAKEQEEAEQLAMAQYNCAGNDFNLIEVPYIAVRMMVISFLKKYSDQVIDEAFYYDPDSFEEVLEIARSKRDEDEPLSHKCLRRLINAVEGSIEYLEVSDAE